MLNRAVRVAVIIARGDCRRVGVAAPLLRRGGSICCHAISGGQILRKLDLNIAAESQFLAVSQLIQNVRADCGGVADGVLTIDEFAALGDCVGD